MERFYPLMIFRMHSLRFVAVWAVLMLSCFAVWSRVLTPTPGEFPIVASTVLNREIGPQPGDLQGVYDCGFNVCMEEATADRLAELVKNMEGTPLKLLMYNWVFSHEADGKDWREKLVDFVNKYKDHPNVAGWEFGDEPKWANLQALKERYDLVQRTAPNSFISFNLVGEMAKDFTGPCKNLEEYLDTITKVFPFDVLSSDYYPIMVKNGKLQVNYRGFYKDLDAFSKVAKREGLPMWTYCMGVEYDVKVYMRPAATVPHLNFEVFSALGYGSQGIVYWTYWERPSNSAITFISALVNLDGTKTPAWYAAQKVNRQVKALTPVFLGAEMVECRHTGDIDYELVDNTGKPFGPIDSMSTGSKGVQLSHLENNGKKYILLVNHDITEKQAVSLNFNSRSKVNQIQVTNKYKLKTKKLGKSKSFTLDPGGYLLLQWD